MKEVCAVLLAAGKSTRMGTAKQLLNWKGQPLLKYQLEKLCRLPVEEIVVILGYEAIDIRKRVHTDCTKVTYLECENFEEGLSASLKCALSYISRTYSGVLFMLVDLPLLNEQTMKEVLTRGVTRLKQESKPFSVQPSFMEQAGHPVFIGNYQGLHWQSLKGDTGAKPLIQQVERKELIDTNDIGITFDIDTPEAYKYAVENYL